jgi:DNA polymerase
LIVSLDFETYFGDGFTLRKLSTSEYIRHELFKVHMMGLKIDDAPAKVVAPDEITAVLAGIDWRKADVLCHHTAFDGFILKHHFNVVPRRYLCTLSMARGAMPGLESYRLDAIASFLGLGEKLSQRLDESEGVRDLSPEQFVRLAEYCAKDVELCRSVFDRLRPQFPDGELELIDITARMFCDPVLRVDAQMVDEELESEIGGKVAALLRAGVSAERLLSNQKFAAALTEHQVPVPMKVSKATGNMTYAFSKQDPEMRALLHHPSEPVRDLVEARLKVKSNIGETRAKRFLEEAQDGPLPVYLNYYGAHTGRWSGGNKMNMQNLPRPEFDDQGNLIPSTGRLRRALMAPEGFVLAVADSNAIEARMTAWLADEHLLVDAYREGRDIYCEFASSIYGRKITKADKIERFVGKTCILGLGYGMGAQRLRETLLNAKESVDMPLRKCRDIVDLYRNTYSNVPELWTTMQGALHQMVSSKGQWKCLRWEKPGKMHLPNGLALRYLFLTKDDRGDFHYENGRLTNKIYGGLLTENVVQALARIVVADQMRTISRRYHIVTMTHDEVVALIPEDEAEEGHKFMIDTMSQTPEWAPDLPVLAEGGYDVRYSK